MPYLNWISDSKLQEAVLNLLNSASNAKNNVKKTFGKNVIDPFSAVFEMAGFEMSFEEWLKSEESRQAQKTYQNAVGDFHQNILGSVRDWENLKVGQEVDVVCHKRNIIAEIKNKHNTVTGGKLVDVYNSFDRLITQKVSKYKGYTAYYVPVIPKKSKRYDIPFVPSNRATGSKCVLNENIREIDGASFYHLVTGEKNALEDLFDVLPLIISKHKKGKHYITNAKKVKMYFEHAYGKRII